MHPTNATADRPARRPNPRRRFGTTLVAGIALVALAACNDSGVSSGDNAASDDTEATDANSDTDLGEPDQGSDTTEVGDTDAPETTDSTPPESTDAPPSTAAAVPEPGVDGDTNCGALAPLIGSASITSSTGLDWDGDGSQEANAIVYDTAPGAGDFRLRVEHDGMGSEVAVISDGANVPVVLGAVQVDFSLGSDQPQPEELLVTTTSNSSGFNLGVFFRDDLGCVARFKAADDSDLELPIHASLGSGSGLACEGTAGSQFLVRTTATPSAGSGEYDVHDIRLRRDGDRLVDDVDIPGFIIDDGSPDSPFLRYSSITGCNVVFPDF